MAYSLAGYLRFTCTLLCCGIFDTGGGKDALCLLMGKQEHHNGFFERRIVLVLASRWGEFSLVMRRFYETRPT